ncbi:MULTISPECIES: hypothetical protein [Leisingera]|jgi:hypothetical protein|uniref:hypothetical protein n=1 Tax=Leisingera TaxID=191028 RepID=UPI00114DF822|nr:MULTISPECIES: hypothetical protein [Leisingera]QDI76043.1 hypothetical protein R2C4_09895 [Leisingera aquaemixtae]
MIKEIFVATGVVSVLLLGFPAAVGASGVDAVFRCEIDRFGGGKPTSEGGGGWLPAQAYFEFSDDWRQVQVIDSRVVTSREGKAEAKVKQLKDGRLKFKWRISRPTSLDIWTPVGFRAEVDPQAKTGVMRAKVSLGYHSRIRGDLKCEQIAQSEIPGLDQLQY